MGALYSTHDRNENIRDTLMRSWTRVRVMSDDPGLDRGEYLTDVGYKYTLIKLIEWGPAHEAHSL
jgi:hypothetical protein